MSTSILPGYAIRVAAKGRPISGLMLLLIFFSIHGASAQTLFKYGNNSVSKEEFLTAYNKNNSDTNGTKISYADYLDLYTKFKLKVQAALDAKMDTLASQKTELEAFRFQLAENFMKEDASIKLLTDEAFERAQKDISISYAANESQPLQGTSWITAFVLPYDIENIVYSTPAGKYSAPFNTANGSFVIKINETRKAVGTIRIAQILLAFRPEATDSDKNILKQRADSLYNLLKQGASFSALAKSFSDDNLTYQNGGELPAFGVGKYEPVFEDAAFSLEKDGDFSKPFKTDFGYHIISRIQRIPVISDKNNKEDYDALKEKVLTSDRMEVAHVMLVKNIRETIKKDASAADLENDTTVLNYYRNHLEKYNSEFASQLEEFRQGNLLFAIMQEKVWDAASSDSAGLANYYNQHKDKYYWENSADVVIFTAANHSPSIDLQDAANKHIGNWKKWIEESNGAIQADSGRFELGQIPVVERTNFQEGLLTAPVINPQDSSSTFAYIIRLHNGKQPKNFEEAMGSVINDYQGQLEEQWIESLKKKYPLKLNKKVFNKLK